MILIGSIAVPSYSPGIGNEVTIKMRIQAPSAASELEQCRFGCQGARVLLRRVDQADGLAAMPLTLASSAGHAAVERLDGRVENAARRIEMVRAESIRIAGQAGARKGEMVAARQPVSSSAAPGAACSGS